MRAIYLKNYNNLDSLVYFYFNSSKFFLFELKKRYKNYWINKNDKSGKLSS